MINRRAAYESHRKIFSDALEQRKQVLAAKKIEGKVQRRDPKYRQLQAEIKKYDRRLKALVAVDELNADLERRRAERAAQPKVKKEKKAAPVEAPKGGKKK